jgi:gamma-glutamyltranspeptidase/glutathione hydrolase
VTTVRLSRLVRILLLCCLLPHLPAESAAAVQASSTGGVVVAGSAEAAEAGLAILRRGGTAADAAVAVSLCLGVTEPFGSGVGGKLAALYYDAGTKETVFVDGMGVAPAGLPAREFAERSKEARDRGYGSACVPGNVAALELLHGVWGKLPWKECVEPAVALARDGYKLPAKQARVFRDGRKTLEGDEEAMALFYPDGTAPAGGQVLANPDLAKVLQSLADEGPGVFYRGWIADKIAAAAQAGGGWITKEDLENYRAVTARPLTESYRDCEIFTVPPPLSGGAIMLLAAKTLENEDYGAAGSMDAGRLGAMASVFRQVYPVITRTAGDDEQSRGRVEEAFAVESLRGLREASERGAAPSPVEGAAIGEGGETSHFVVVDREGNIACITQSLSHHFGAGVVVPGTGILLNNDMSNFAYRTPGSVNYVAPGKKPRSTVAPTLVFREGRPVLALGAPGGQRIPSAVFQVLTSVLDFGRPLPEAVDEPRVHLQRPLTSREPDNAIDVEEGLPEDVSAALAADGWSVNRRDRTTYYFAAVNGVQWLPDGTRVAVGDERRSNHAVGE